MTESELHAFMAKCRLGVLGTVCDGRPQAALVGIAVTPRLEIVFDTVDSSRKWRNLNARPECSFVLGWTGEQTVQYEGRARMPAGAELQRFQEIYFQAWPDGPDRLNWPGIAYFVVQPLWIRFSDYGLSPPSIREFTFPNPESASVGDNSSMKRIIAIGLILAASAWCRDKKLPSGEAGNEAVHIEAACLDAAQLKETFGTDFDNMFSVVEVTLTPRGGKQLEVHLDDFLVRSEQTGAHSGPLAPSQIAGQGTLVVHQSDPKKGHTGFGGGLGPIMMGGGGSGAPPPESRVEVKNSETRDPLLDVLKRKILPEKPVGEPVTGLLFFPLDKEKPKNLVLIYTTPQSASTGANAPDPNSPPGAVGAAPEKLRIRFK